jgi:hypothetical protein
MDYADFLHPSDGVHQADVLAVKNFIDGNYLFRYLTLAKKPCAICSREKAAPQGWGAQPVVTLECYIGNSGAEYPVNRVYEAKRTTIRENLCRSFPARRDRRLEQPRRRQTRRHTSLPFERQQTPQKAVEPRHPFAGRPLCDTERCKMEPTSRFGIAQDNFWLGMMHYVSSHYKIHRRQSRRGFLTESYHQVKMESLFLLKL